MSNYFGSNNKGSNNAFGIVTVMDVRVYDFDETKLNVATPLEFLAQFDNAEPEAVIDHMQVATLSTDGPNITIQGGKFNNTLLKYGKTARCEMTDALGQADALVALGGAEILDDGSISITDKFGAAKTLIGKTFVVDKKTGKHVDATVILYQFLPDSTPSFAFDSGNAATFDLNGDLLAVELGGQASSVECGEGRGLFFSIVDDGCSIVPEEGKKTVPVEHTDDIILAPSSVTRLFAQQTQPSYAPVVAMTGVTPKFTGYKADGTPVDNSSSLGELSNGYLTLWGSAQKWTDVAFLRIEANS